MRLCRHGSIVRNLLQSPIGDLEIASCDQGIVDLQFKTGKISSEDFHPNNNTVVKVKDKSSKVLNKHQEEAIKWLNTYFSDPRKIKDISLPAVCTISGISDSSSFTEKVWHTLATKVPFGKTISYGELAGLSGGKPGSSRAVGQAMRNNDVAIIVPCHRVVLSSGALGNYSGGEKNCIKEWLIQHENY